ncbi:uncharacterized protein LOC132702892 [Cylas formicarius]|uniref:uncharacterized protein LOC132702892 n=1 Tax=Cylas formicarius TaxID=197179 RepID=UPI002958953D|nr:uncharacterized protein LOC132702892 [Cylas formicarius]
MSSSVGERKIRDVRDLWNANRAETARETAPMHYNDPPGTDHKTRHKYKTLERHLSMKKTIRKKMMRDLREIGDASSHENENNQTAAFLEQIKNDQPPPESVEKPSLWKRLTKGWTH